MQKMFLLVTGLACVSVPGQGFAQTSKLEKPGTVSGGGWSMGRTNTSTMGQTDKQNLPRLQTSAKPTRKMVTENSGRLQSGVKPGQLDRETAGMQNSTKPIGNSGSLQSSVVNGARAGVADSARSKRDSLGDMSSEQQMRMQMSMDRKSKLQDTLSNVMKKQSQTDDSITKNMK